MAKNPTVMLLLDRARSSNRGLLRGFFKYAQQNGPWHFTGLPKPYLEPTNIMDILKKHRAKIDGLFTYVPFAMSSKRYRLDRIPCVAIPLQRTINHIVNITGDWMATGEAAAYHLMELGFRRFAFCGCEKFLWSRERGSSFCKVVVDGGYEVHRYPYPKSKGIMPLEKELPFLVRWLQSLPKPIGLFAWNDERCEDVIEACHIAGFKIPDDIAILGVDNDEFICNLTNVPLSSIEMNFEETGFAAASALDTLMNGKKPKRLLIPVRPLRIAARKSTDVMAYSDRDIVQALKFIKENANRPMQVGEVVQQTSLSKRTLQMKFRQIVGRSIQEQMIAARIERASKMLIETDFTVVQIANKLNFSDVTDFTRRFKKVTGLSPTSYRKHNR